MERNTFDPICNDQVAELTKISSSIANLQQLVRELRLHLELRAGFNPDQPRDDQGRWTDAGGEGAAFEALLRDIDGDTLPSDVAYPGDFHDVVRDHVVKVLRHYGNKVETEVSLVLPGNPPFTARLDILARGPQGT